MPHRTPPTTLREVFPSAAARRLLLVPVASVTLTLALPDDTWRSVQTWRSVWSGHYAVCVVRAGLSPYEEPE